jgi:DnaJ-class molecular chaperone
MKVNQNKTAAIGATRLRFHTKCGKCAGLGKKRNQRCAVCLGRGYVLNNAGRQRSQEVQDAWCERLQT